MSRRAFTLRVLRRLLIISVIALLLLLGFIAFIGSRATLSPPRRSVENWHREWLADPQAHGVELTSFTSSNGTPALLCEPGGKPQGKKAMDVRAALQDRGAALAAWGEVRGTILLLHGHKGCKEDHLPIAERFCAAGFRCLCVDLPGHGQHPAPYATFGHTEMALLAGVWQDFLASRPEATQPLFLFGVSQGGAIALQTAARPEWPVRAVASVCSFTTLDQPIDASADHLPVLIRDLKPLTTRACDMGIYCHADFFPVRSARSPQRRASIARCFSATARRIVLSPHPRRSDCSTPCRTNEKHCVSFPMPLITMCWRRDRQNSTRISVNFFCVRSRRTNSVFRT